jgi:hypothetical protein
MKTTHTTHSCDLHDCDVIVDAEDEYSRLPTGWVTVSGPMRVYPLAHDHEGTKMFCGWPHAAEWAAKRAKRPTDRGLTV